VKQLPKWIHVAPINAAKIVMGLAFLGVIAVAGFWILGIVITTFFDNETAEDLTSQSGLTTGAALYEGCTTKPVKLPGEPEPRCIRNMAGKSSWADREGGMFDSKEACEAAHVEGDESSIKTWCDFEMWFQRFRVNAEKTTWTPEFQKQLDQLALSMDEDWKPPPDEWTEQFKPPWLEKLCLPDEVSIEQLRNAFVENFDPTLGDEVPITAVTSAWARKWPCRI